jgi:excisionase family DNA binding protein
MNNDPDDLLSTATAATIACVSQTTIDKWCLDGDLPAIRPGGAYLIKRADLMAFLAKPRKRPGQYDRAKVQKRGK